MEGRHISQTQHQTLLVVKDDLLPSHVYPLLLLIARLNELPVSLFISVPGTELVKVDVVLAIDDPGVGLTQVVKCHRGHLVEGLNALG